MTDPAPSTTTLPFHLPRFRSPVLIRRLSWLAVATAFTLLYAGLGQAAAVLGCAVLAALIVTGASAFNTWRVLRAGGLPPITVSAGGITLPRNAGTHRTTTIPVNRVRAVIIQGRDRLARLSIDAGFRRFTYPAGLFQQSDAEPHLRAALRSAILAQPGGRDRWAAIAARNALWDRFGAVMPLATMGLVALFCAAYGVQQHFAAPPAPLTPMDFGAEPSLVAGRGQWFRLVSANLLHGSREHLLGNALFLLIAGFYLERLAGAAATVMMVLGTGVVAITVSAAAAWVGPGGDYLYGIGISGAVFGVFGALAVITARYYRTLPAALRLPWWIWAVFGIPEIILPAAGALGLIGAVPVVDHWGHGGGFAAGCLLALLLTAGADSVPDIRRGAFAKIACAGLITIWIAGTAAAIVHAANPENRLTDRMAMADSLLQGSNPALQSDMAWAIATYPSAPDALLRAGLDLATRAVNARTADMDGYTDTLAVLHYRLGDIDAAVRRQLPIVGSSEAAAEHWGVFLDQALRKHGPLATGPSTSLEDGIVRVSLPEPAGLCVRVYVVVRREDRLIGLLTADVPPHQSDRTVPLGVAATSAVVGLSEPGRPGCADTSVFTPVSGTAGLPVYANSLPATSATRRP